MQERSPNSKLAPLGLIFAGAGLAIVGVLVALVVGFIVFLMVMGSAFGAD